MDKESWTTATAIAWPVWHLLNDPPLKKSFCDVLTVAGEHANANKLRLLSNGSGRYYDCSLALVAFGTHAWSLWGLGPDHCLSRHWAPCPRPKDMNLGSEGPSTKREACESHVILLLCV